MREAGFYWVSTKEVRGTQPCPREPATDTTERDEVRESWGQLLHSVPVKINKSDNYNKQMWVECPKRWRGWH